MSATIAPKPGASWRRPARLFAFVNARTKPTYSLSVNKNSTIPVGGDANLLIIELYAQYKNAENINCYTRHGWALCPLKSGLHRLQIEGQPDYNNEASGWTRDMDFELEIAIKGIDRPQQPLTIMKRQELIEMHIKDMPLLPAEFSHTMCPFYVGPGTACVFLCLTNVP